MEDPVHWQQLFCGHTRLLTKIALAMECEQIKVANLFVGGCSLNRHYEHICQDAPVYRYDVNEGAGWVQTPGIRIREAIESDTWDWIAIQHGSGDGSWYSKPESYVHLPDVIAYVRQHANPGAKIAFNMTWVGEPDHPRQEMIGYGQNQVKLMTDIAELTRSLVAATPGIDCVSSVGVAVQNARAYDLPRLTRDGYHLTVDLGCYIAGLTFWKALTGADISDIPWAPDGMDEHAKAVAIAAVNDAAANPFVVTKQ